MDVSQDFVPRHTRRSPLSSSVAALALGLLALAAVPDQTHAVAYRLPNQDPEAIARGNAFAASANNPSAIYYNPAGIAQLPGTQTQVGLYLVNANIDFQPASGGPKVENKFEFQPVPELYLTHALDKTPFTLGLGIYAPYGLGLEYPEDSSIRNVALKGKLLYATVNPVIAWQAFPTLSLAIGPTLNASQVDFRRGIGQSAGDLFRVKGDGFDAGFTAGLRWQPEPKWAVGLKYHSGTTIAYDGHSELKPYAPRTDTTADLRFPQFVVGGIAYHPTPEWTLEVNVDWTDWDHVNQAVFEGTAVGDIPFPFHFQSSWMYEFGVTRELPGNFRISAGYFFSENSSPDQFFNPIIPDADLHLGSIGLGYRTDRWDFFAAYHFAMGSRTVAGNIAPIANGSYDLFNQAFSISARFKF